jgi:hypothetical protein
VSLFGQAFTLPPLFPLRTMKNLLTVLEPTAESSSCKEKIRNSAEIRFFSIFSVARNMIKFLFIGDLMLGDCKDQSECCHAVALI